MPYPYEFQISPTLAGITYFPRWGIAWPDRWPFQDWAVTEQRSDGTRAGFGFPRCVLEWDNMGQSMLFRFLNWFVSDDDASVAMYLRTYKSTGVRLNPATFLCLMHRPMEGQNKTIHARVHANRVAWSNVSIEFTRLEEQ